EKRIYYNAAVAVQEQLSQIGMNVILDEYDWATFLDKRSDPEMYDIFHTGFTFKTVPEHQFFTPSYDGFTDDPDFIELMDKIKVEESQEGAKALYENLQQLMWERLPIINVGHHSMLHGLSESVEGYRELQGPIYWGVSLDE